MDGFPLEGQRSLPQGFGDRALAHGVFRRLLQMLQQAPQARFIRGVTPEELYRLIRG